MAKRELDLNEVIKFIETLPYNEFKDVVNHYSQLNKVNFSTELDIMTTLNFEGRLKALGINSRCPNCDSDKIKKMVKEIIYKPTNAMNVILNTLYFQIQYWKRPNTIGIFG